MNEKAVEIFNRANTEWNDFSLKIRHVGKLRTCNANVYESSNFYFLMSYTTIVAVIEKSTDTLVDMLRMVYGYTATSAQHIAKFGKEYLESEWGYKEVLTYR